MINLLDLINAADPRAISETNFQRIDASLAFALNPSLDLTGNPTALMGPPVAGAWVMGQFWVDGQLAVWRCTVAGSPGTWIQIAAAVVGNYPAGAIPNNYLIRIPAQEWGEFYWNGFQWLPVYVRQGVTADSTKVTADSTTPTVDQI